MDHISQTVALSLGTAWASGINLYAAVAMLGILSASGSITLPPEMSVVSHPLVIAAAIILYCIEFFADKIPGLDSAWDALHTFIRIPAGAILASQAFGHVDPGISYAAMLVGGTLAASTHATKAGTRLLINTSPEPFSNWAASFTEDIAVVAGLWTALHHPALFLVLLVLFVALLIYLLPLLWRGIRAIGRSLKKLFGFGKNEPGQRTPVTPAPQGGGA